MAEYGGESCRGFACYWVCQGDGEQKRKSSREGEVVLVVRVSCGKTSVGHEEEVSLLDD